MATLASLTCLDPDGVSIGLCERDATLVAVAERHAESSDGVVLVTDDERLLYWLDDMLDNDATATQPFHVLQLLGNMVDCGAITTDDFLNAADAEEAHHSTNVAANWIHHRKQDRIKRLVNALAMIAEDRHE
jgi:hypothetical protein